MVVECCGPKPIGGAITCRSGALNKGKADTEGIQGNPSGSRVESKDVAIDIVKVTLREHARLSHAVNRVGFTDIGDGVVVH